MRVPQCYFKIPNPNSQGWAPIPGKKEALDRKPRSRRRATRGWTGSRRRIGIVDTGRKRRRQLVSSSSEDEGRVRKDRRKVDRGKRFEDLDVVLDRNRCDIVIDKNRKDRSSKRDRSQVEFGNSKEEEELEIGPGRGWISGWSEVSESQDEVDVGKDKKRKNRDRKDR